MDREDAPIGRAASLFWMTVLLLLTNAGVLLVTHQVMPQRSGWGLFGGWLLNLVVIVGVTGGIGGKIGQNGSLFFLVILFAVYALVYGMMGGHVPRLFGIRETPVMPVRDADLDAHRNSDVFHFSDGQIDSGQAATRSMKGRGSTLYYHVAPLLPPDWKTGDLIPAWVGQSGLNQFYPSSWKENYRGGFDVGLDSTYRDLIVETVSRRSLKSSRSCPILVWSQSPREDFLRWGYWELGCLLAIDLIGIVTVLWPASKARSPAQ